MKKYFDYRTPEQNAIKRLEYEVNNLYHCIYVMFACIIALAVIILLTVLA